MPSILPAEENQAVKKRKSIDPEDVAEQRKRAKEWKEKMLSGNKAAFTSHVQVLVTEEPTPKKTKSKPSSTTLSEPEETENARTRSSKRAVNSNDEEKKIKVDEKATNTKHRSSLQSSLPMKSTAASSEESEESEDAASESLTVIPARKDRKR